MAVQERGLGIGPVSGVRIERINVRHSGSMKPLVAAGNADGAITDVLLQDVVLEGTPLCTFDQLGISLDANVEEPTVTYRSA
ncbi:hypothetical protein [Kribbella sp. NPDC051718]|uniref:hypothetical protein n=1 Tax=Kribbella sp. NPDC051718 TaxID=3155168 RepID=UPI003431F7A5